MTRLAIISDLHVDINGLFASEFSLLAEILQEEKITHLHFAGDLANKVDRAREVVAYFTEAGFVTTFNWGNHEMADLTEAQIEDFPAPGFLNFKTFPLSESSVLLGYNGWYDYAFAQEVEPEKIPKLKELYWYDRMIQRTGTDPEVDAALLRHLRKVLNQLQKAGKDVILATHFVPQKEFIIYQTAPKLRRWNELNAFLGSAGLGRLLDQYDNISHCVFGHTHRHFPDLTRGKTVYSCRPFGYYFEWQLTKDFVFANQLVAEYAPMKLRGILRRNQAAFDAYKKVHLAEEFRRSMTIIERN